VLGIFIPLIVTNCIIIGRAEAFASRNNVASAWLDGIMMSVGFMAVLMILGGIRELLANGTLFDHAHLMFGEIARNWTITFSDEYQGFLFVALPPGAFMGLAFILAFKNYIDQRASKTSTKTAIPNH
jgi:electron transport complex protein RnfE